ncbi:MAG: GGDEF domain-containing protein [Treponemataceae bacterium]
MNADDSDLLAFARSRYQSGDLDEAEAAATEALETFLGQDELSNASRAFDLLGSVNRVRGEYDKALERYMKSLELARSVHDLDREAAALNDIGEVLTDSGEQREALSYFMRASELLNECKESSGRTDEISVIVLLRIGQTLLELGETENAAGYLELALDAADRASYPEVQARACATLAVVEKRRKNREKARALLDRALKTASGANGTLWLIEIMLQSADLYIDGEEYDKALSELAEAAGTALKAGARRKLAEAYRLRSLIHEKTGNIAESLADYKRFHEMEDAISGERVARLVQSAEVHNQLESARQEAEIYRLRNVELKERRHELELTNARLRAVAEIGREVASSLDTGFIASTVFDSLTSLIDVSDFCLAVLDSTKESLDFSLAIENKQRIAPFSIPVTGSGCLASQVITRGEPLLLSDVSAIKFCFGKNTASAMYVPLFLDRLVIGVIGVQSPRSGAYSEEDLKLLSALASFVAVALENSRIHEELGRVNAALQAEKAALESLTRKVSHIANHDGLTGLPNRLLLSELLDSAITRAVRSKKSIAVMYLDLDNFKPINDAYGHMAGDLALVVISQRLKRSLRASDTVARVGGDEFVAIAADLDDPQTATTVAEKLVAVCRRPIDVQGHECRVGVSIGISLFPKDGRIAEELLRKSDESLYRVKRSGKNGFLYYGSDEKQE